MRAMGILLLVQILASGCRSDGERLRDFAAVFSKDFFQILPDSAVLAGQAVPVERLLKPCGPAVLGEKQAFFENKLAELRAIPTDQLDEQQRAMHGFLMKKTARLLARLDSDLSLFNPLPVLKKRPGEANRLVKKLPAYFAAAKLNFTGKKGANGRQAVAEGIELFRFLAKLKSDSNVDTAMLAVKDWIAFAHQ